MSDLLERLQRYRDVLAGHGGNSAAAQAQLIGEAIEEIERMKAVVDAARTLLKEGMYNSALAALEVNDES
jgi:hypothetical protein